jgi:hypothetical protein
VALVGGGGHKMQNTGGKDYLKNTAVDYRIQLTVIYLLTATGLTPVGTSTVQYIFTHKQYTEHNKTEYTERNIHNNNNTKSNKRTQSIIIKIHNNLVGRNSSVGIATRYGLDGPGIETRMRRDFPHLSRPALWPTQPPIKWVPGLCRG